MSGVIHGMAGNDKGGALPGQVGEVLPEGNPQLRVEADRRLIEKEQGRVVDDGAGQADPLFHAAAELHHLRFPLGPEVDQFDDLIDPR